MSEQLKNLLLTTLIVLAIFLLWALSIGATYWDSSRRKLSGAQTTLWMILVVLLPGIGFAAYLFSKLLLSLPSPGREPERKFQQRITQQKRAPEYNLGSGTIPAADLARSAIPAGDLTPGTDRALAARARKHYLAVTGGPQTGREYALNNLPARIGRGPQADIRLDEDLGVSRQHAEIYEQSGMLRIRDLRSTHGTYVNDFSIDDKSLEPGDRIQVGVSILVVDKKEKR
ncbi:MAG: FHA domain-containing protein [Omnitrophica WOR_2 bacterium]